MSYTVCLNTFREFHGEQVGRGDDDAAQGRFNYINSFCKAAGADDFSSSKSYKRSRRLCTRLKRRDVHHNTYTKRNIVFYSWGVYFPTYLADCIVAYVICGEADWRVEYNHLYWFKLKKYIFFLYRNQFRICCDFFENEWSIWIYSTFTGNEISKPPQYAFRIRSKIKSGCT